MRKSGSTTLLLAGMLMVHLPATARADDVIPLYPNQCAYRESYPTACATLRLVHFDGNSLTLIVSNTTTQHDEAWISELLFKFSGSGPFIVIGDAQVTYGTWDEVMGFEPDGSSERDWILDDSPSGNQSGLGAGNHDWDLSITPITSGNPSQRSAQLLPGISVKIVIQFQPGFAPSQLASCVDLEVGDCQQWTAHIQSIGEYGGTEDSGWTTMPEPATMILLGSGLVALAGVGIFRRREKLIDE